MKGLILALDFEELKVARSLLKRVSHFFEMVKIGPVLFLRYGPSMLAQLEKPVFLDMKFYDIPNTIKLASKAAKEISQMFTVAVEAGFESLKAAVEEAKEKVVAVTKLTSLPEEDEAIELAQLAVEAGAKKLVAGGKVLGQIKRKFPQLELITPGIRLNSKKDDQVRTLLPEEAAELGADWLVIGRAVTKAENPEKVAEEIRRRAGLEA